MTADLSHPCASCGEPMQEIEAHIWHCRQCNFWDFETAEDYLQKWWDKQ